jgi:hypothetical protein
MIKMFMTMADGQPTMDVKVMTMADGQPTMDAKVMTITHIAP